MVSKECHKFLNVFSKEAFDTLLPHSKYNHQIRLLEGYRNHGNSPLNKMSKPKLQFMKKFLKEHLKKSFIWDEQLLYSTTFQSVVKDSSICSYIVLKYKDRKRKKKISKIRISFVSIGKY